MNLHELAPYVVRTDHSGVELALPSPAPETGRFVCAMLAVVTFLLGFATSLHSTIWFTATAVFASCAFVWPYLFPNYRLKLRLEQDRLVLREGGARVVPTVELLRVEIVEGGLRLWRADGTVESLDLPLEHTLQLALARILRENVLSTGIPSQVPEEVRRLRGMPEQG